MLIASYSVINPPHCDKYALLHKHAVTNDLSFYVFNPKLIHYLPQMWLLTLVIPSLVFNTFYQGGGSCELQYETPDTSNWFHSIAGGILFPYIPK